MSSRTETPAHRSQAADQSRGRVHSLKPGGRKQSRRCGRSKRKRRFARETLYEIVAEVCRLAAALYDVKLIDVSVSQWKACARQPEIEKKWGRVPAPNEICRQLCDGDDDPSSWIEVKRRAFLPPDQLRAAERALLREAPRRISKERARYSLQAITREFGVPRAGRDYKASLARLVRRAHRRSRAEAAAIKRTFATESQILALYDNWEGALADADLHPTQVPPPEQRRGISWPQAAALYQLVTGKTPTVKAIKAFARKGRFSIPSRTHRMQDVRAAAAVLIRETDLEPGTVSLEAAATGLGLTLRLSRYTRVEVIEAGQRYARTLRHGEQASDDGYYAYRLENPGEPSLTVIKDRHGGVRAVVREGERQDWRQRAIAWDARKKRETAARREAARTRRTTARRAADGPGRVPSERTLSHLLIVEQEKAISTRTLAALLGVHRVRAQQILKELRNHGAVEPTVEQANSPHQTYRLTTKGRAIVAEIKGKATRSGSPK